jgi:hypothetical protein
VLDRSLQAIFRNFSTLFLAAALVTLPLHLAYSAAMRGVIATSDLHDEIATFPPLRQVEGVGREDLSTYRLVGWIAGGVELLALVLFVGVTRRVVKVDEEGGIPGVLDGWSHALAGGALRGLRRSLPAVLMGFVLAIAVGLLSRAIGMLVIDPLPDRLLWAGVGLVEGCSRALAAPFAAAPLALSSGRRATEPLSF